MSKSLEEIVNIMYQTPSDINEHIPTLIKYGSECRHITEMGVRWITSTWAFLGCIPERLISIDMRNPSTWDKGGAGENAGVIARGFNTIDEVYAAARTYNINYEFIQANVLDIEIEETDLLFLDTWHAYKQLKAELDKFHSKVKKYIVLHDTTTYANTDETNYEVLGPEWKAEGKGIWLAVEEFLSSNKQWSLQERFTNNNGLTILKRIE
jgi:hypothetical protein